VADMRARLHGAKPAKSRWEAKNGPGRLMDIELAAQMLALWAGSPARGVIDQIRAGELGTDETAAGNALGLSQKAAQVLVEADMLLWTMQCGARLLTDTDVDISALGSGGQTFLLRETSMGEPAALTARLDSAAKAVDVVINDVLVRGGAILVTGEAGDAA
jgi:[glutamine synthetase] adenylyltransferase / [glutamine synthetase]-adenylyl-L-tyrosine phosphorylase